MSNNTQTAQYIHKAYFKLRVEQYANRESARSLGELVGQRSACGLRIEGDPRDRFTTMYTTHANHGKLNNQTLSQASKIALLASATSSNKRVYKAKINLTCLNVTMQWSSQFLAAKVASYIGVEQNRKPETGSFQELLELVFS